MLSRRPHTASLLGLIACALLTACGEGGTTPGPASPVTVANSDSAAPSRVMVTVVGNHSVRTLVVNPDAAGGAPEVFAEGRAMVLGCSAQVDAFVAIPVDAGRARWDAGFQVLDASGAVVASGLESACTPLLVDRHHAVVCARVDTQATLVSVDLQSNARTPLGSAEGDFWDDIPLTLTPDGEHVIFFLRGEARGLVRVPLAGGDITPLPEHSISVAFSAAGDEAFVLLREAGQERELRRYAFADGVFSDPRPMVEGGLFGLALDAERALVLARSGEAFEWQLFSLDTGAARTVDSNAHVGDGTGFGAFARIPRDRIVYVGQSATGAVLRVADLSGNAEPRDLLAETFLGGVVVAAVP